MPKKDERAVKQLCRALLKLQTLDECERFLKDAFTTQEIDSIAQRFDVACRIHKKESYVAISNEIGVSTATICRVSKCCKDGAGGYGIVIKRMQEDEDNDQ